MPYALPKKVYELKELKSTKEEEILTRCIGIVTNYSSLKENLDIFLKYAKYYRISNIMLKDYESALMINELVNKGLLRIKKMYLLDDMKQIDRSYIDITLFKDILLVIPNTYVMWNVKYKDKVYAYQYKYKFNLIGSELFSGYYDHETITEVKRIASIISEFSDNLTEVEKIIIISNYLQMYNQFVDKSNILDNPKEQMQLGDPKTSLLGNHGVCRTFADATTLLSNNPYLKLNVRNVCGQTPGAFESHAWNIVKLNGKLYHLDNSRAISRGENRMSNVLKASNFNKEYLLFGEGTLHKIKHEKIDFNIDLEASVSYNDFDRGYIEAAIEYLRDTKRINFEYDNLLSSEKKKI